MHKLFVIALICGLLFSCEKPDEKGRFRAAYIGKYDCDVQITRAWGDPSAPDSLTTSAQEDTVKVYFGDGFDQLILLDDQIPINSSGEYSGNHALADPAQFNILFSETDSIYIDFKITVPEGQDTWEYTGKKIQ